MGETKFFLTLQLRNMGMAFEISIIKTIAYCEALACIGVREWGGQGSSGLVDQDLVALEISRDSFIPDAGLQPL